MNTAASPLVKVTELRTGDRISLGTLGSAKVFGKPICVYPFRVAIVNVQIASGHASIELSPDTMVEVQDEVSA